MWKSRDFTTLFFSHSPGSEEKLLFEKKSPQPSRIERLNSIPCQCDNTPGDSSNEGLVKDILDQVINDVIKLSVKDQEQEDQQQQASHDQQPKRVQHVQQQVQQPSVEIDCTEPEIRVSPRRTVEIDIADPPDQESSSRHHRRRRSSRMKPSEEESSATSSSSTSTANPSRGSSAPIALPMPSRYENTLISRIFFLQKRIYFFSFPDQDRAEH